MKRILISFLMLCAFALQVWAQSTQLVQIREYRQKQQKTPLEGVSLTVQNAGSAMSDAQGNLTLQFRSLKAGDQVQVRRVDLSGYEIFNKDAVDQWTISPQQTFSLVLCKSERFKALRDQYMRVSSASYERQYKQDQARLETLKKENKLKEAEYQEQLLQLEDNYYEQLDNLENYVDRFARIDLSEIGEQEQRIVELVQEGNIDEAVRLYESGDYLGKYQSQVKDIQEIDRAQARLAQIEAEKLEARDNLFAAINRQVQVYQLAGGRENWEKIHVLLKGVADADTTNVTAVLAYASDASLREDYEEHEKYAFIALRHCTDDRVPYIYYSLAAQYVGHYMFDKAESVLSKAIEKGRLQKNKLPLMVSMSYLHSLYCYIEEYDKAASFSDNLYALIDTIADIRGSEDAVWDNKCLLDIEMAQIAVARGDSEESLRRITSSYQLSQKFKDSDGLNSMMSFADNLTKIIFVTDALGRSDLQEKYQKEQIEVFETLYQQHPRAFLKNLFEAYNNMSDCLVSGQRLTEAWVYLDKAMPLIPMLETNYGSTSSIYLMGFYDTLAHYWEQQGDSSKAKEYAALCMANYSKLPAELQEVYQEVKEYWNKFLSL